MSTIGETIRRKRHFFGMTQGQLAEKLGISASTIGMYEQGRRAPNNEMLLKICELFGMSADSLLGMPEHTFEAVDIIKELTDRIRYSDKIMLNGMPMGQNDREKLLNAIEVATQLTLDEKANGDS